MFKSGKYINYAVNSFFVYTFTKSYLGLIKRRLVDSQWKFLQRYFQIFITSSLSENEKECRGKFKFCVWTFFFLVRPAINLTKSLGCFIDCENVNINQKHLFNFLSMMNSWPLAC